ncbi:MAG TPA: hypothetical protein VMJ10_36080 [Kofleriaceae bacterium]|nr:hypothetical protein [Kofleriaceae bacterium]
MRILLLVLCAVTLVATAFADPKYGRQVRYGGPHPIPKSEGGGMCYIEGPHVHVYAANELEYRVHGDDEVFVGDPVAYGWDGPKYSYSGPHPIIVGHTEEYCYIQGPHFHAFMPPEGPDFKVVGGAYFYVGTPPQVMIDARPRFVGINEVYRPMVYTRPVIAVAPPEGWIGVRAEFAAPGVVVEGRHGEVIAPAPGVGVGIEAGVHVALPPPPSVHVGIGVGIGGPAPVVVGPAPRPVVIERHDVGPAPRPVGRHDGWGKGHR